MIEITREWNGWQITASRFDAASPLQLRAEDGAGRTIYFDRQYRRVLDAGSWREPNAEEAEIIAAPATLEAIRGLRAAEEAEESAEESRRLALLDNIPEDNCVRHPGRPATQYSQSGERVCDQCYARG